MRVEAGEAHAGFRVKSSAVLQQQLRALDVTFQACDVQWEGARESIDVSVRPSQNPFHQLDVIQSYALLQQVVAEAVVDVQDVLMLERIVLRWGR